MKTWSGKAAEQGEQLFVPPGTISTNGSLQNLIVIS